MKPWVTPPASYSPTMVVGLAPFAAVRVDPGGSIVTKLKLKLAGTGVAALAVPVATKRPRATKSLLRPNNRSEWSLDRPDANLTDVAVMMMPSPSNVPSGRGFSTRRRPDFQSLRRRELHNFIEILSLLKRASPAGEFSLESRNFRASPKRHRSRRNHCRDATSPLPSQADGGSATGVFPGVRRISRPFACVCDAVRRIEYPFLSLGASHGPAVAQ